MRNWILPIAAAAALTLVAADATPAKAQVIYAGYSYGSYYTPYVMPSGYGWSAPGYYSGYQYYGNVLAPGYYGGYAPSYYGGFVPSFYPSSFYAPSFNAVYGGRPYSTGYPHTAYYYGGRRRY